MYLVFKFGVAANSFATVLGRVVVDGDNRSSLVVRTVTPADDDTQPRLIRHQMIDEIETHATAVVP